MCTQKPPHDYSEELYRRYRQAFENYIKDRVIYNDKLYLIYLILGNSLFSFIKW